MLFVVWSLDSVVYFPVYTGVSPRAEVGQSISFEILHYSQAGALSVDTQCVVLLLGASYNKMEAENVPSAGRVGKSTPDLVEIPNDICRTVKRIPNVVKR